MGDSALTPEQRIDRLEARVCALAQKPPADRSGWDTARDWLDTIAGLLTPILVLLVGIWLKDSVELALKREELSLQAATALRDVVEEFRTSTDAAKADANAVALSLFGKYGIAPLIEELGRGVLKPPSAEKGLRLIAADHPVEACARFAAALGDPHRRPWQAHLSLIQLIGESRCKDDLALLQAYRVQVAAAQDGAAAMAALAQRFDDPAAFDRDGATQILASLDDALAVLQGGVKP